MSVRSANGGVTSDEHSKNHRFDRKYHGKNGVLTEHGLSTLIETGGGKVLFNSRQGAILENNIQKLKLDLSDYDPTGGLHPSATMPQVFSKMKGEK